MKVSNINNVYFKSVSNFKQANVSMPENKTNEIKQMPSVTPDFNINIPQKYSKLSEDILGNGLVVHSYKLSNGHRVTIIPMEGSPAVVKNYVNVGSMNETHNIKGISHFLEHMAFNGTNGQNGYVKLDTGDSFKKIEALGGWTNASTNYAVTDYVNSTPLLDENDIEQQIKVIAAMTEDLKLSDKMIEKEKGPVCSEINMILDDPQTIALDNAVRSLYNIDCPTDELVGGSVESIKNLTRNDVKAYYDKYYTPDNMNLVITGDVDPNKVIDIVAKNFKSNRKSKGIKYEEKMIPINSTVRNDIVNSKATNAEVVLGFLGPKNSDYKEKLLYSLAKAYLSSYACDFDKNLKELNVYPYLGLEKISTNPNMNQFSYCSLSCNDNKVEDVLSTIYHSIKSAPKISQQDLDLLKEKALMSYDECFEYSEDINELAGKSILDNQYESFINYKSIIDKITPQDVDDAIHKYFNVDNTAITVVHPNNKNISFQGKHRLPLNISNVDNKVLDNNVDISIYNSKSDNIKYRLKLVTDKPYIGKPGVVELLNEIYTMGNTKLSEDDQKEFNFKNNIALNSSISNTEINLSLKVMPIKFDKGFEELKTQLYLPALNQENLEKAKKNIKENLSNIPPSAIVEYNNYDSKNYDFEYSTKEILDNIDSITLDDIADFHNYLIKNSRGIVTANVPQNNENIKNDLYEYSNQLQNVLPNKKEQINLYKQNNGVKVLTKESNNSQADVLQVHKFKYNDSPKELITAEILNSLLNSSSIGLFNTLREKEHLAYSVHSYMDLDNDMGKIMCNILTTTDNKEIGETTYDNVKKSINGFNRQINELKNGTFTDEDFENAKKAIKADFLNNEGVSAKLSLIMSEMNNNYGLDYYNNCYNMIDSITKEDVLELANQIFTEKPVYSVVATSDTLENNKEFFENLKK